MAIHDAYARRTPYELLLPDGEWPDRHFPAVEGEGRERGLDPWNPAAFVLLGAAAGALDEIRPEDATAGAAHDHAGILYYAYHMWRSDTPLVLVRRKTLLGLLDQPEGLGPNWTKGIGGRGGYLQLPQHLVWLEEAEGPPESVDGLMWVASPDGVFNVALATGMRTGRPGLGMVPVPAQPTSALEEWAMGRAREDGPDFATSMPGAEIDGLLGIRTPGEVMKLAGLILREAAVRPPVAHGPAPVPDPSEGPRATQLRFTVL